MIIKTMFVGVYVLESILKKLLTQVSQAYKKKTQVSQFHVWNILESFMIS